VSGGGRNSFLLPGTPPGPIAYGAVVEVAGRSLSAADLMAHCRAISLTGLPALSVPVGGGLSVQFVGPDGGEGALCAVAADLAAYLGRADHPDRP
jgi:amidase